MSDQPPVDEPAALHEANLAARRVTAAQMPNGALVQLAPTMVFVGTAEGVKGQVPLVRIESVNGSFFIALDPDQALAVSRDLRETAMRCKSGLLVPSAPGEFVLP